MNHLRKFENFDTNELFGWGKPKSETIIKEYPQKGINQIENLVGPYIVLIYKTNFVSELTGFFDKFQTMGEAKKFADDKMSGANYGSRTMSGWYYEPRVLSRFLVDYYREKK